MGNTADKWNTTEQDMDALVLFCMELLENVPEITSALKMLSERVCQFFELDDVVYAEHEEEQVKLLYQWSVVDKQFFADKMCEQDVYSWKKLVHLARPDGSIAVTNREFAKAQMGQSRDTLVVLSTSVRDFTGSVVFADRKGGRDWEPMRSTLVRISNQIFYKLRMLKKQEAARLAMDLKLNYDALTGLPVYNKVVSDVSVHAEQNGTEGLCCIYTDFSCFHYYKEIYGYELGDFVLKRFAEGLKEKYGERGTFCRLTSDNFAGFVYDMDVDELAADFKRFTNVFAEECNKEYPLYNMVLATGIYPAKANDISAAAMIDNANEARKKCKEQTAETMVRVYTEDLRQELENIRMINSNILKGLKNQEFHAYLQPKVSLDTGEIAGAEALVRWIRPDGTRVMPDQFIGIAEQNGYITKIDFAVLEQVLEYLEEAVGAGEEVVPISVNFSRKNNEIADFVPRILERLDAHHVSHDLLEAEVTESVFMADLTKVEDNMSRLRNEGVEVSVDDFGSGYSSLNILTRVSADTIKLDRLFLNSAKKDERGLTVIQHLTQMLKRLGFTVIAEGVETEEQLKWMQMAECDLVQGFYYAKPMSIPEFRTFLKEFNATARSKK